MARLNKNLKATSVTIRLNREQPETNIFLSKDDVHAYLYAVLLNNWDKKLPGRILPSNRTTAMELFFSENSGNSYFIKPCIVVATNAIRAQLGMATKKLAATRKKTKVEFS